MSFKLTTLKKKSCSNSKRLNSLDVILEEKSVEDGYEYQSDTKEISLIIQQTKKQSRFNPFLGSDNHELSRTDICRQNQTKQIPVERNNDIKKKQDGQQNNPKILNIIIQDYIKIDSFNNQLNDQNNKKDKQLDSHNKQFFKQFNFLNQSNKQQNEDSNIIETELGI